jgi:membrane-bound lytic murein transglycosylase D
MSWKNIVIIIIAAACIFEGFLLLDQKKYSSSDLDYAKEYLQNNRIYSILLPNQLSFAMEQVPMNIYYVREGLDRELSVNAYWQSNTLILIKKANRFFPVIEPILKKYNVPDDFKYLALIESGLSNVASPAGASGFWQFIPETGKKHGLEITEEVDERYHVEKSTVAACKYLNRCNELFKSWTLTAAAYNAGESRIQKELARQKQSSYYDLYLNTETSRYIYRILALKLIYEHPTEFGYFIRNKDLYPPIPTYAIEIDTTINNLAEFAVGQKLNYRVIKDFNPWLRKDKLTVKEGKKYTLILPRKGFENYESLLKTVKEAEMIFHDTASVGKLFN